MLFRRGSVTANVEDYLDPRRASFRRFLENGLYHAHLTRWQGIFPQEQLAVLLFEDVLADPEATVVQVAQHIGVAHQLVPQPLTSRVNDSRAALMPLALRKLLAPAKNLAAPLRGSRWFEAARATVARPVAYPPLPDETRRRLEEYYAPDVSALSELIGRDLGHWLPPSRVAA